MLHQKGKVIIVGAGPGDPELLTVKAARWLQRADVVLTDRLVSEELLREFVRPGADIIPVGKQARKGASTPQSDINRLLVFHAVQGRLVVRLKGGDVSIFSNVLDELLTLVDHQIPYEIVPGVTSALGAAAYAGIPLTARGHASAVRFLTLHQPETFSDSYWKELAATDDTLVFYMSGAHLPLIQQRLRTHEISTDKKIALVEQATTPCQRVTIASVYEDKAWPAETASPALLIIGRVVDLHERFAWLANAPINENHFQPVAARLYPWEEKEQLQTA